MRRLSLKIRVVVALLAAVAAHQAQEVVAAPVDSDLAAIWNGGGCTPTGIQPALLDMLVLVNPEWTPIVNGLTPESKPVLVHGTVVGMHGDNGGDYPATHVRADVNHFVRLDPADAARLATGNDDGLLHFEWEAGAYPAFAWAGESDRIVGLGRWIFDCGHPAARAGRCSVTTSQQCVLDGDCQPPICSACGAEETCRGVHFGYSAELHPPQATAAIRTGRGAVVSDRPGARAVRATKVDVFVSPDGGGAGDRCIVTHRADPSGLLSVECFPLSEPLAPINTRDFVFRVPLPPHPGGGIVEWRVIDRPTPGGVAAPLRVRRVPRLASRLSRTGPPVTGRPVRIAAPPSGPDELEVSVEMTRPVAGRLPTGFAATIVAGWRGDATPLVHVRTTLDAIVIRNALQLATPLVPRTCSTSDTPCATSADCPAGESCFGAGAIKAWQLQAAVNGEWQELEGLESIDTGDVVPQTLVYDQYLPAGGALRLQAHGASRECVTMMYAKSLATDLAELGFDKGVICLASTEHPPGEVDVTFSGPDFGAGPGSAGASATHETVSKGGQGGGCSATNDRLCVIDGDCPTGETCVTTGSAFALRYTIQRLP